MRVDGLFRYNGDDGTALAGFLWRGASQPKAILQLAHGAGEHAGRYRDVLQPVIDAGYVIYAADHRGHGLTSGLSRLGSFGPAGVAAAISDMAALARLARQAHPGLPLILLGHSMGAMFAQSFIHDHASLIDALVLSGTSGPGPRSPGSRNGPIENPRTDYDWLSRDAQEVDAYIADPFCGIAFDADSDASLKLLREDTRRLTAATRVMRGLPVYVFVGDADPVNDGLRKLHPLVDAYRAAGLQVKLRVYEGGRHEMLNELNRDEVVGELIAWLDKTVAGLQGSRPGES